MIDMTGKAAAIFGVRNELSIAFAVARKLQDAGAKVALSYVADTRDEVLFLVEKHGFDSQLCGEADVRDDVQVAAFLQNMYDAAGPIHAILHGTAFGNPQVMGANYLDIPFDALMDSFNISAYSLVRICRAAEPLLAQNASVLTLTYNAAQRVFPGYAGMSINKAALENMVIYLADHFRNRQVRVNAISAGLVMTTSAGGVNGIRKIRKMAKATAPLGNIIAADVADTALYYFSDLSKKVTGNIHFVDGGFNIMGIAVDGE